MGLSLWVSCFIVVVLLLPIPPNEYIVLIFYALLALACIIITFFKERIDGKEALIYLMFLTLLILVSRLAALSNITFFSTDSVAMIKLSRSLLQSQFDGYPVFLQAVQMIYPIVGLDYFPGLFPLVAVSLSVMMTCITSWEIRRTGVTGSLAFILAILPAMLLFTTYHGIIQIFYYNHHLIAASLILLFAASIWLTVSEYNKYALYIGTISLAMFVFTRHEGLLFAIALFFIFVSNQNIPPERQRNAAFLFTIITTPWCVYLTCQLMRGSFVSDLQYLGMLIMSLTMMLVFQLNRFTGGIFILAHAKVLGLIVATLSYLLFIGLRPEHMLTSSLTFFQNMFSFGGGNYWGVIWYFIIIAGLFALWAQGKRGDIGVMDSFLISVIVSYLLILALTGLRMPLINRWYDSANRMLIHFLPLLLVWIISNFSFYCQSYLETKDMSSKLSADSL